MKSERSRRALTLLLVLIAGFLLGFPAYPLARYVLRVWPEEYYRQGISDIINNPTASVNHSRYKNEDYIGFLIIEGTNIYYPLVKGEDNEFYLDHDWTGGYNYLGGIFMDYRNSLDDEVMTIYGHYTTNESRFAHISKYLNENFNPDIYLHMKDGTVYTLEVFSFAIIGMDDMYEWRDAEKAFKSFKGKSIYDYGVEYNGEKIIFLSTCASPTSRYVVSTLLKGGQAE